MTVRANPDLDIRQFLARRFGTTEKYREFCVDAYEMFLSVLSRLQRESLERIGSLRVVGSEGGIYTVAIGHSGNIRRGNTWFCAHPMMQNGYHILPVWVAMMAQVLMIKTDERRFLEVAIPTVFNGPYERETTLQFA